MSKSKKIITIITILTMVLALAYAFAGADDECEDDYESEI